jgi:hypothetical protein
VIDLRHQQHSFGEGFIHETVDELWEDWMRQADAVLEDETLLATIYDGVAAPSSAQSYTRSPRHTCGGGTADAAAQAYP